MAGMWARMTGRTGPGKKCLPADLQRVTHSGVLDIPQELLTPVVDASMNEEDRPEIMKHLRECLAESSGKNWRRVYGALVLVEALVKNGSTELWRETAEGRHFDLVQRLSFLEHFDNTDKRVANNVRKKAEALRKDVVPLIQNADCLPSAKEPEDTKDTASTCSPGSTVTRSTTISSSSTTGFGSDDIRGELPKAEASEAAKRTMILNNIVAVGHSEDTTSESEGGEDKARGPVQYREPKRMTARERNERRQGHSSDSDGGSEDPAPQQKPVAQAPAHTVDLLGL